MMRRWLDIVGIAAVVAVLGFAAWRLAGQSVNVVIVNASGVTAQFSWQPSLFAEMSTVDVGGCESKSILLLAGERWRLTTDYLDINSNSVDVPLVARAVALEIWLDPGHASRLVPAYQVEHQVDAPNPECGAVP